MSIELPSLPYAYDALEPVISSATLKVHHGRHHQGYVDKLNALVRDTPVADSSLDTIVQWAARETANGRAVAVFNNAAQAWTHAFYWRSLRPAGERGARPRGRLAAMIASAFGSYGGFVDAFKSAATGHFGSGWAWLVVNQGMLEIVTTSNADTPIVHGQTPLLVIDVWEHAYYLDYKERRPAYIENVVNHLLDWEFAERNFNRASSRSGDVIAASSVA